MRAPEDVRWCRLGRRTRRHYGWIHFLASPIWGRLLGRREPETSSCTCGRSLPEMACYSFTFQNGDQVDYEMGQCVRCRTIYWDKL